MIKVYEICNARITTYELVHEYPDRFECIHPRGFKTFVLKSNENKMGLFATIATTNAGKALKCATDQNEKLRLHHEAAIADISRNWEESIDQYNGDEVI